MSEEEKDQMRVAASRLFGCEDISAMKDMLDILLEALFTISTGHTEPASSKSKGDAKLIMQMIFTKLLNLRIMFNGVGYKSRTGKVLNNIIDPTSIAPLVRAIFETVLTFNLIYNSTDDVDKQLVLYNMWVISSLKYRQDYNLEPKLAETIAKKKSEAELIDNLKLEIETCTYYQGLSRKGKETIQRKILYKDFKVDLNTNPIQNLPWDVAAINAGLKPDVMGDMYSYFSLYAHPSNFSVFAFADLFNKESRNFVSTSIFQLKSAVMLVSFFISDYIKVFPNTTIQFDALPLIEQIVINFHGKMIRSDRGTINNALDELN